MGAAFYARKDPLRWFLQWPSEYGDVYRLKSPFGEAAMVNRPEFARQILVERSARYQKKSRNYRVLGLLMGNGLVTSEGEFWRGQRKLIQPAFHRRRLDVIFQMMTDRINASADQLSEAAATGEAIDLCPRLSHLTLDIISRAMFSADVQGVASDVSRYIHTLNDYGILMIRNPWMFLIPAELPIVPGSRSRAALRRILGEIIDARRGCSDDKHDDLLSMLLAAADETTGRGMTDEQLRDEAMTMFVAGHETTANAMAWLIYLVSTHAEVEECLLAEIDRLGSGLNLSAGELSQHGYVRQVIEESLRLRPSIWSVGRRCTEADELGEWEIPAGMNVVMPLIYYHWSDRFWADPMKFDPDRFLPARRPAPDSMVYFPFGAGPRSCIGNQFAMQELMLMTILLFRRFRFRLERGFDAVPDPLITLRPKAGMRVVITERN